MVAAQSAINRRLDGLLWMQIWLPGRLAPAGWLPFTSIGWAGFTGARPTCWLSLRGTKCSGWLGSQSRGRCTKPVPGTSWLGSQAGLGCSLCAPAQAGRRTCCSASRLMWQRWWQMPSRLSVLKCDGCDNFCKSASQLPTPAYVAALAPFAKKRALAQMRLSGAPIQTPFSAARVRGPTRSGPALTAARWRWTPSSMCYNSAWLLKPPGHDTGMIWDGCNMHCLTDFVYDASNLIPGPRA
jgi:hypothetical protein